MSSYIASALIGGVVGYTLGYIIRTSLNIFEQNKCSIHDDIVARHLIKDDTIYVTSNFIKDIIDNKQFVIQIQSQNNNLSNFDHRIKPLCHNIIDVTKDVYYGDNYLQTPTIPLVYCDDIEHILVDFVYECEFVEPVYIRLMDGQIIPIDKNCIVYTRCVDSFVYRQINDDVTTYKEAYGMTYKSVTMNLDMRLACGSRTFISRCKDQMIKF